VNLHLLQRKPEEWRDLQSHSTKTSEFVEPLDTQESRSLPKPKDSRKRKRRQAESVDEIDAVFEDAFKGRRKKGSLMHHLRDGLAGPVDGWNADNTLQDVLGAIKAAPG
jgi:nucleolar protein 9